MVVRVRGKGKGWGKVRGKVVVRVIGVVRGRGG